MSFEEAQLRWERLRNDALAIRQIIFEHGGMANKSAVEDVMMRKHPGLDRSEAHDILNHIEYHNMIAGGLPEPLEDWIEFFAGVRVQWFRGNPFDGLAIEKDLLVESLV